MFTGLVKGLGKITHIEPLGKGAQITIFQNAIETVEIGDSIAINGVCSTVVQYKEGHMVFQYLEESLKRSALGELRIGDSVNLEDSLTPHAKIGGHFVTGHVDCCGQLLSLKKDGPWHEIKCSYPAKYHPFLIEKGSIAIDGISLTVVDVSVDWFTCHIIPHTFDVTRLGQVSIGDNVHLEFDMLGKYLFHFYSLNPSDEHQNRYRDLFNGIVNTGD